jgi:plasmid replication initiation protein
MLRSEILCVPNCAFYEDLEIKPNFIWLIESNVNLLCNRLLFSTQIVYFVYTKEMVGKSIDINLNKDPSLYTVWMPILFLDVKWGKTPELAEEKTYIEILGYNHVSEPDRLAYEIPYQYILPENTFKNRHVKSFAMELKESLHHLTFFFDEKKMAKVFPELTDVDHLRSIGVFITIDYYPSHFIVHLHPDFKRVLLKSFATGFTKGDIDFIRSTKCKYSPRFYFRVRYWQYRSQKREVFIDELRSMLEIEPHVYQDVRNLRRKVLDVIQEEFKNTFVEFTYEAIKEGHGSKVLGFMIHLKNGANSVQDVEVGKGYSWESIMKQYGVYPEKILRFRNLVRDQVIHNNIVWDNDYIAYSIEAFQEEIKSKKKNLKLKQVKSPAAYLVEGLENGFWLSSVIKRKNEMEEFRKNEIPKNQINLPFQPTPQKRMTYADKSEFEEIYRASLAKGNKKIDWRNIRISEQGLEEFILAQGYTKQGSQYVKFND